MVKTSVRVLRSAAVTGREGNDSTERRNKVSTVTVTGDQTEENRGSHHGIHCHDSRGNDEQLEPPAHVREFAKAAGRFIRSISHFAKLNTRTALCSQRRTHHGKCTNAKPES